MESTERQENQGSGPQGAQYLTFKLADDDYGVEILSVQEIKSRSPITPIPNTPDYVKGVMNLRGKIIPVMDLGLRLGKERANDSRFAVIVVVKIGDKIVGLAVDAVSDVLSFGRADLQSAAELGAHIESPFVQSVARSGER